MRACLLLTSEYTHSPSLAPDGRMGCLGTTTSHLADLPITYSLKTSPGRGDSKSSPSALLLFGRPSSAPAADSYTGCGGLAGRGMRSIGAWTGGSLLSPPAAPPTWLLPAC
jgi:hypothetical protein